MSERYVLEVGSASAHCCFEWSVMDTQDLTFGSPRTVCECFEQSDAELVVKALNELDERRKP